MTKTRNMVSFINAIWVTKNAEFDADFESVEKVAKSYQQIRDREKEFFTVFAVCKSLRSITFLL
jgi:hypothetical protein